MDAQMLKAQNKTSKFVLDIKFCRNVICGHSTLDHEKHPQMGCLCYYCKKHWRKTGGPPCFKLPRYGHCHKWMLFLLANAVKRQMRNLSQKIGLTVH